MRETLILDAVDQPDELIPHKPQPRSPAATERETGPPDTNSLARIAQCLVADSSTWNSETAHTDPLLEALAFVEAPALFTSAPANSEVRREQAVSLTMTADLALNQDSPAEAGDLYEQALDIYRSVGDTRSMGRVHIKLGKLCRQMGDPAQAEAHLGQAIDRFRDCGDKAGVAYAFDILARLAYRAADYRRAKQLGDQSILMYRRVEDKSGLADALNHAGKTAFRQREFTAAEEYWMESLDLLGELGDRQGMAVALDNLGLLAFRQQRYEDARLRYRDHVHLSQAVGDREGQAWSLHSLGEIAYRMGNADECRRSIGEAEEMFAAMQIADGLTACRDLRGQLS